MVMSEQSMTPFAQPESLALAAKTNPLQIAVPSPHTSTSFREKATISTRQQFELD